MKPLSSIFLQQSKTIGVATGLVILLVIPVAVQAQRWPFELWHEGKMVLVSGDTLKGHIKYDLQKDLVQYMVSDDKVEIFSARKVLFFEIFEEAIRQYRRFFALPFTTPTGYKTPIFFELLAEGKMTLLAREYLDHKTYSSPYFPGSYSRVVLDYLYYFLKEDGTIETFSGNRNDLLDRMEQKSEAVEQYMKSNRLKSDDKQDLIRTVEYYNSLFRS